MGSEAEKKEKKDDVGVFGGQERERLQGKIAEADCAAQSELTDPAFDRMVPGSMTDEIRWARLAAGPMMSPSWSMADPQ
ncbi:MAG: hypothetical protein IPH38_18485 [Candidatus Microthrix sp.]|nr:hypothetical protein [Candidatus Microthrix sp.]MBK7021522.1 hypothetical protein [Candidatus Microthrix sp.]